MYIIVILRSAMKDLRASATTTRTNCVQVCQSVRPNRTVSSLGANMKEYATCEHSMDHSAHTRLCEYLFEVANAMLTVPKEVGNLPGNRILLQLETTEDVKGSSSTHWKGCDNDEVYTREDW